MSLFLVPKEVDLRQGRFAHRPTCDGLGWHWFGCFRLRFGFSHIGGTSGPMFVTTFHASNLGKTTVLSDLSILLLLRCNPCFILLDQDLLGAISGTAMPGDAIPGAAISGVATPGAALRIAAV